VSASQEPGAPGPGIDPQHDNLALRLRDAERQLRVARAQLLEAEQRAAGVGQLQVDLHDAREDLAAQERRHADELFLLGQRLELSQARADHLERLRAELQDSLSWKVTAPLRAAKRAADSRSRRT